MKASVLHLLRAKVLLHRDRVVGPSLDRRVVRHDHHQSPAHRADARHHAARRHRFVAVQVVAGERGELKEGRAGVEEGLDALPREHLAACRVQRPRARATALVCHRCRRANLYQLLVHPRGVREEGGARGVDRAIEHRRSCRTRAQQPTASRTHNRRAQRLHDPGTRPPEDRRNGKPGGGRGSPALPGRMGGASCAERVWRSAWRALSARATRLTSCGSLCHDYL